MVIVSVYVIDGGTTDVSLVHVVDGSVGATLVIAVFEIHLWGVADYFSRFALFTYHGTGHNVAGP